MSDAIGLGRQGRLTPPAAVRRALALEPGQRLDLEIVDGRLVLTLAATISPAVREQLERHRREGKIYRGLGPADLERLVDGAVVDLEPFAVPREGAAPGDGDA
jgi:bifunctional DNA-binding transcriptional regulator/antitoxin component of YhaV-PrlF toxin-antitoxin module